MCDLELGILSPKPSTMFSENHIIK